MKRALVALLVMFAALLAYGQEGADVAAHTGSQSVADILRDYTGSDAAFVAAVSINKAFDKDNLASLMQYPNDEVVVVTLTGAEIKQALERSVSLYPLGSQSFLQLSGIEATFSKSAAIGQRIVSVNIGGSKLDDKRSYTVAMPGSLGRGGAGYFKIWDASKITKTFDKVTLSSLLKGKHSSDSAPRWSVVG